jgi:transposase InsO family protein
MLLYPLPRGWPKHAKTALLHAIAMASTALAVARGHAASRGLRVELDRAMQEISLLREELDLKDARWVRLSPRRRPHYSAVQRLRILQLKAARGWSCEQAAEALMIDEQTLKSWLRRVDEKGESALVQTTEPVNRFPDFVRYLVRQLRVLCPEMGKIRIAQVLARAGLHLGATTVGRMLREAHPPADDVACAVVTKTRRVTARYPGELWHLDLTAVPIGAGFWVPWLPFTLPQSWPFCWWIAVIVDHVSRAVVGFSVHSAQPTSEQVQATISRAIERSAGSPRSIVTDKGPQFWCRSYRSFCRDRGICPRFGAAGRQGSIAVVERFIGTMKKECTSRLLVPLSIGAMRREVGLYVLWYNNHRPSQALEGRTPQEVYEGRQPANVQRRYEPRRRWPAGAPSALPKTGTKAVPGARLALVVSYVAGRKHLPVVELREAA